MKPSFYAAASGLTTYQQALDNIGNNIANANTQGYKAQGSSFEDLLYQDMYVNLRPAPLTGSGVRAVGTGLILGEAPLKESLGEYDFAITMKGQDGFFAVQNNAGDISYTRNGAFAFDVASGELVTAEGLYVLNQDGGHITIEKPKAAVNNEKTKYDDKQQLTQEIGVYVFDNPSQLDPISGTLYQATEASGVATAAVEDADYKILQGFLEQSGVSVSQEMTNMILAQRGYQMSARVLQTADLLEDTINNLRK